MEARGTAHKHSRMTPCRAPPLLSCICVLGIYDPSLPRPHYKLKLPTNPPSAFDILSRA